MCTQSGVCVIVVRELRLRILGESYDGTHAAGELWLGGIWIRQRSGSHIGAGAVQRVDEHRERRRQQPVWLHPS